MMDTLVSEVNLLTVSEKTVKTTENSQPIFSETSAIGNSIVDIKIFTATYITVGRPFCKNNSIIL